MVLEFYNNNQEEADQFMLSSFGGYDESQLTDIKTRMIRNKNKYRSETLVVDRVF